MLRPSAWQSVLLGLGIGCVVVGQSAPANAFCRQRSCDKTWTVENARHFAFPCVQEEPPGVCLLYGPILHWKTNCLSFSVQRDGSSSASIDLETAEAVIEIAFETWAAADCGGGQTPSLSVVNRGPVECRKHEYNPQDGNANIFLFRDDEWPYPGMDGDALALTTVTYNVDTGEIIDADVEFRTSDTFYTVTDDLTRIGDDFASIVTHEVGHFLGLAHTSVLGATMTAYSGGSSMRSIEPDDVAGVCAIYPPGEALSSECPVRNGFSGECGKPPDAGCAVGAPNQRSLRLVAPALALAALLVVRRGMRRTLRP